MRDRRSSHFWTTDLTFRGSAWDRLELKYVSKYNQKGNISKRTKCHHYSQYSRHCVPCVRLVFVLYFKQVNHLLCFNLLHLRVCFIYFNLALSELYSREWMKHGICCLDDTLFVECVLLVEKVISLNTYFVLCVMPKRNEKLILGFGRGLSDHIEKCDTIRVCEHSKQILLYFQF